MSAHTITLTMLASVASSALFAVFGLIVWRLDKSAPVNRAFGAFGALFALGAAIQNIGVIQGVTNQDTLWNILVHPVGAAAGLAATYALLRLIHIYPALPPAAARAARPAARMTLVAAPLLAATTALMIAPTARVAPWYAAGHVVFLAYTLSWWYGAARYALAFPHLADDPHTRRNTALMAAALTIYATQLGFTFWLFSPIFAPGTTPTDPRILPFAAVVAALALTLTVLWLRATHTTGGRAARNLAWVTLLGPLAVLLSWAAGFALGSTIARVVIILLLTYAILRHDLLGIDLKVRWGLSKSTIAAAFIAIFFIASETAQEYFGEVANSQYIGIAAAGALVFFIAPLQSVAERLAKAAIPDTPPARRTTPDPAAEESYRHALRWTLRDGTVTQDEERRLIILAENLGIPPSRAYQLRDEVGREPVDA